MTDAVFIVVLSKVKQLRSPYKVVDVHQIFIVFKTRKMIRRRMWSDVTNMFGSLTLQYISIFVHKLFIMFWYMILLEIVYECLGFVNIKRYFKTFMPYNYHCCLNWTLENVFYFFVATGFDFWVESEVITWKCSNLCHSMHNVFIL